MALPINIKELVHGKVVEWERLEFKKGWNPEEILHSICAFANDLNNWGGGYIIVGIDEIDGVPQLPPVGLPLNRLDAIQGELINVCYTIQPNYLPITQPYIFVDKHILVIWAPAGDMRPYSVPSTMGNDARRQYYIRVGSRSIIAQGANLTRLLELTAKVPFDDRINQEAQINDLDLGLIREFLQEVGSDLFDESVNIPFPELCRQMQIARGPVEYLRPVNVGLMFFNQEPHSFFNRAWIELAIHPDDTGRNFIPETFKGPLHHQLRNCLDYLKKEVIRSKVRKIDGQAESITFSNYPFNALEEVISNAIYHKSYADEDPVEIQVFPDKITILSYPGPMPPITNPDLQERRVVSRIYRNRRIGDFLKELDLTEGKSTGFPIIRDAMASNGNPEPVFYTDDQQLLFMVTLPCHPEFLVTKMVTKKVAKSETKLSIEDVDVFFSEGVDFQSLSAILENDISGVREYVREYFRTKSVSKSVSKSMSKSLLVIDALTGEKTREEILKDLGLTNHSSNYEAYIKPLLYYRIIEMTIPDKPTSRFQEYRLTEKGKKLQKK
ncbi:MAG: ATP-binding protein [Lentimicrobium sp.]|jgi:ATP-dependent DNA helicase RecG|nr:ATP-binding protein [Lentimicrobium sp.]